MGLMINCRLLAAFFLAAAVLCTSCGEPRVDRSSPEAVLNSYIEAIKRGDVKTVEACLISRPDLGKFNLPKPIPITHYEITKQIVFGPKKVDNWNSKGIDPPAKINDVEFHVREYVKGAEPAMFSYNFRKVGSEWRILTFAMWGDL